MSDLSVGSTVAGCRLEAVAGRGGMGVVYRATQLALDRPVAVKAIAPQLAEDPAFRERFQHESQLAASIDHPNVIPVYEAGELDGGALYLIMRWVDGTDLRALLRTEGRLAPDRAIRLLRPVASAMAAAHRRGLVHRDIKPANVLIARGDGGDDEHVYLTDFGIARRMDGEGGMTRTGVLVGTLDYTAPERIEGGRGDAASDIYSFGCMLFETLTGAVPFDRPTELAKMHAHVNDAPPSVRAEIRSAPPGLDAVVERAMAKDPADRYATAADLATALQRALDEVETDEVAHARRSARAGAETDETELPAAAPPTPPPPPPTEPLAPPTGAIEPPVAASEPTGETRGLAVPGTTPDLRPRPARSRPSRRTAGWALAAVLAAVVLVVVVASSGGGGGAKAPTTSTHASTPPAPAPPTASGRASVQTAPAFTVPGGSPAGAAVAGGVLWVAVPASGRLVGLATGRSPVTVDVGGRPRHVATDARGRVWVTHTGTRQASVVDPGSGHATRIATGADPRGVATTATAAWVANAGENSLTRIDLRTLTPRRISLPAHPTAVVSAYGRVWVANADGEVSVFDGNGNVDALSVTPVVSPAVAGTFNSGVWLLGPAPGEGSRLTRIDPRRSAAHQTSSGLRYDKPDPPPVLAGPPGDVVAAGDSIWVGTGRAVTRLGVAHGRNDNLAKVSLPGAVGALAVDGSAIWAVLPGTRRVYRITF